MAIVDDLKAKINEGRIIFDPTPGQPNKLRDELLGNNSGTKVTEALQRLVLAVCALAKIRISSIVRSENLHGMGCAFDIGNEEVAKVILPILATDAKVAELAIDEIIFDATVAGESNRNKWNYDQGNKHDFDPVTLDKHRDHVHFGVKGLERGLRVGRPKLKGEHLPGAVRGVLSFPGGAKEHGKERAIGETPLVAGRRGRSSMVAKEGDGDRRDQKPRAKKKAPAKKK